MAVPTVAALTRSPIRSADHRRVKIGCTSCSWAILATPPAASPRYQAKNPRNMLTTETYANPAHAAGPALTPDRRAPAAAAGAVIGSDATSAQQITLHPPISRDSLPPSA